MIISNRKLRVIDSPNIDPYIAQGVANALDYTCVTETVGFIHFISHEQPAIVLGKGQLPKDILLEKAKDDGVCVYKRCTGGTSVWLGKEDIGYTMSLPKCYFREKVKKHNNIFILITGIIQSALEELGVSVEQLGHSKKKADRRNAVCFCDMEHGELAVKNAGKIHGGAYIYNGARYLQQGNILVSTAQEEMMRYARVKQQDYCPPISINDTVQNVIPRSVVIDMIIKKLNDYFDIEYSDISDEEYTFANKVANKHVVI